MHKFIDFHIQSHETIMVRENIKHIENHIM